MLNEHYLTKIKSIKRKNGQHKYSRGKDIKDIILKGYYESGCQSLCEYMTTRFYMTYNAEYLEID